MRLSEYLGMGLHARLSVESLIGDTGVRQIHGLQFLQCPQLNQARIRDLRVIQVHGFQVREARQHSQVRVGTLGFP